MDATSGAAMHRRMWIGSKDPQAKLLISMMNPTVRKEYTSQATNFRELQWTSIYKSRKLVDLRPLHSSKHSKTSLPYCGRICASLHEDWLLKTKAQEIISLLNGRSIFLVGMMGSGKTTVGRILSEALGYSFIDSDAHVEQAFGGTSVTQIFEQRGESFFRDCETETLRKLSLVPRQVVATGGGAVVRPINREYMRQGITVFLDVPLDALARRIACVGTETRPLLHFESGDPYTKAFAGLFTLTKKRAEAYSSSDVTISLLDLAENLGLNDASDITTTAIAIEVITQVQEHLEQKSGMSRPMIQ